MIDEAAHAGFGPALRIDWLSAELFADGRRGRLGLTILPGKNGLSERYPGRVFARDLDADLVALRSAGVRRLILLVEDDELARWSDPGIVERGARAGVQVDRHPIPDGAAPASLSAAEEILHALRTGRSTGDVAVACMGGVGRSGTIAACALVEAGRTANEAISVVRAVRHPTAVETPVQQRFVEAFAAAAEAGPQARR